MKLFYTPRSHFARKVRILLDAWRVEVEFVDVGRVADAPSDAGVFGDNPLMKVPALSDGDTRVVDSDHIARYLVRLHDPADQFSVLADDVPTLNARAVMNGVMAAEVELVLAERTGIDIHAHVRFDKHRHAIRNGLQWLGDNASLFAGEPNYGAFHLVCMWDHLVVSEFVEMNYPRVADLVADVSRLPYVAASALP